MRKLVKNNVSWVGYLDWELGTFHGDDYSIKNGSSQNAYLIEEGKSVLVDTVWTPHRFDFVENLKKEIDLKKIDFIVANHGECDHSGSLETILAEIPGTPSVAPSDAPVPHLAPKTRHVAPCRAFPVRAGNHPPSRRNAPQTAVFRAVGGALNQRLPAKMQM